MRTRGLITSFCCHCNEVKWIYLLMAYLMMLSGTQGHIRQVQLWCLYSPPICFHVTARKWSHYPIESHQSWVAPVGRAPPVVMAAFRISTMLLCVGIAVTADRTYSLQKTTLLVLCGKQCHYLKHLWGYITSWVGNLTERKSRVLNEIAGMSIVVPIGCWKYNLVTFWWWCTLNDVLDTVLHT